MAARSPTSADKGARRPRARGLAALLGLCLLVSAGLHAEGRALLVGVGKYQTPGADLPGTAHDLRMMRRVAGWLGFAPSRVRTLRDEAATLAAVEGALQGWLVEGVEPGDPVLIYFSGHGSRIWDEDGDETEDHADEVLMLHDARVVRRAGRDTLAGVLVDDHFAELLGAIPSRDVLVLVDACHSGSVVKALPGGGPPDRPLTKSYSYPGMPAGRGDMLIRDPGANFLALSAAGDDEEALPSVAGSYFTRGLYRALEAAVRGGGSPTPLALMEASRRYIEEQVRPAHRYSPRLSGNPALAVRPLGIAGFSRGLALP